MEQLATGFNFSETKDDLLLVLNSLSESKDNFFEVGNNISETKDNLFESGNNFSRALKCVVDLATNYTGSFLNRKMAGTKCRSAFAVVPSKLPCAVEVVFRIHKKTAQNFPVSFSVSPFRPDGLAAKNAHRPLLLRSQVHHHAVVHGFVDSVCYHQRVHALWESCSRCAFSQQDLAEQVLDHS